MTVVLRAIQRSRWAVDRPQLLILLVGAVMVGSFFLFILWPKQCELTALGEAVEQERGLVNQKVVTSQEGVYVSARIPSLRKAKELCERRLPTEPRVADFLEKVAECFAAEPQVTHEIQRPEPKAAASAPAPAVPVVLRVAGPVEAVYRCLTRIEGLERLSRVGRAHLTAGPAGQLVAETEILVYYLPADGREAEPRREAGAEGTKAEAVHG